MEQQVLKFDNYIHEADQKAALKIISDLKIFCDRTGFKAEAVVEFNQDGSHFILSMPKRKGDAQMTMNLGQDLSGKIKKSLD